MIDTSVVPHSIFSRTPQVGGVIGGVFAASVTPRLEGTNQVDLPAALRLIDYFCDCALRGITLLGATGEFLHLDTDQRALFVSRAIAHSRLPVMVNVSHSSLDGAVLLARQAIDAGAAALLLMPPYYFRYEGPEVAEFFQRFADQVRTSLPLFLYNIPFFTTWIPIEVAETLLEAGVFAGIKDSSGDRAYMDRLLTLSERTGCTVMVGNDTIFTIARSAG
ncbi:MAG: dihydrodipicolinate synthase family protein, partial [Acidobacteriia bacterium]|nr:dihydrodipicolinate synthase family protein [Terriglobia bacterium]